MALKTEDRGAIIIEGHIQGLSNTRSLGEEGIPVFVVDKTDCIARHSKYCKKFFLCPEFFLDEFAFFLIDLAIKENIKDWVLIPSNDHAVYTISKHKVRLVKHYKFITPTLNIIDRIYDKIKLLEIAKQVGVPVPVTELFDSAGETLKNEISYPVITKGRNGLSFYKAIGKKVLLANNDNELRKNLLLVSQRYSIDSVFAQELIPFNGDNYTISFTAFCVNGVIKIHWTGVKIRDHPFRFGTATFAKSIINPVCYQQSVPLLRELKYTGVCEIEYIHDPRDGEYKLIEINPRTWLWVGLAKRCGIDYAKLIYEYATTKKIPDARINNITIYWHNPFTDTAYSLINLLKGKIKLITYIKSIITNKKVNALFAKNDIKPGLVYLCKSFYFLRNR